MVHLSPSSISSDGQRISGSVMYLDYISSDLCLNYFTAPVKQQSADKVRRDYPSSALRQSWIADYPLLAYKTPNPMDNEIAVINMAQNMPQRIITLPKEVKFVCFVNHTQMAE